jgi:hypothetical protein
VHQERNKLIYQLAGDDPSKEQLDRTAARVDHYLVGALHGARVLLQTTADPSPPVLDHARPRRPRAG